MSSLIKRILSLILVCAAVLSLAACGKKQQNAENVTSDQQDAVGSGEEEQSEIDLSAAGVTFTLPKSWKSSDITISAQADTVADGITVASAVMYSLSGEEATALQSNYADDVAEYQRQMAMRTYNLFYVFGLDGGRGEKELRNVLADLTSVEVKINKLGKAGEWTFFSVKENLQTAAPAQDKKDAVESVLSDVDTVIKSMKFCEPTPFEPAEIGSEIAFITESLDKKIVYASELFAENKITVINIWEYNGISCIQALPDFGNLYREYEEKGCGMIGIVHDYDDALIGDIRFEAAKAGATYMMLRPSHDVDEILPTKGYPTTYFVDREGKILCEPVIGADTEKCAEVLDELLSKLG